MAVQGKNRRYRWNEIRTRHWIETAKRCGFGDMKSVVEDLIARTPVVIDQVRKLIPSGFPGDIADSILTGISARVKELAAAEIQLVKTNNNSR